MVKKIISLAVAAVFALALLTSCSGGGDTTTLYVYNWGEYISDGSEDSLDTARRSSAKT